MCVIINQEISLSIALSGTRAERWDCNLCVLEVGQFEKFLIIFQEIVEIVEMAVIKKWISLSPKDRM